MLKSELCFFCWPVPVVNRQLVRCWVPSSAPDRLSRCLPLTAMRDLEPLWSRSPAVPAEGAGTRARVGRTLACSSPLKPMFVRSFALSTIACFSRLFSRLAERHPVSPRFHRPFHILPQRVRRGREDGDSCLPFWLHGTRLTLDWMTCSPLPMRRKVTLHREYPTCQALPAPTTRGLSSHDHAVM